MSEAKKGSSRKRRAPASTPEVVEVQVQTTEQQLAACQCELELIRAAREQLNRELQLVQAQLKYKREIVEVMRTKLAHERSAKAILEARLLSLEAEIMEPQPVSKIYQAEETAPVIDSGRQLRTVQGLVAALGHMVATNSNAVSGLSAALELPAAARMEAKTTDVSPSEERREWHSLLAGQMAGKTLTNPKGGPPIVREGELISHSMIDAAEQAGLLFHLILTMQPRPRDIEL